MAELTRAARRANVTFYAVDPRGLDAGPNIAYNLSMEEWRAYVDNSVSTLRVLSDETGGFCICMTNNFKGNFQKIDNEMSDYYMLGYTSSNPGPAAGQAADRDSADSARGEGHLPEGIYDQAAEQAESEIDVRRVRGASATNAVAKASSSSFHAPSTSTAPTAPRT